MTMLQDNVVGIDASIFMHPLTWKASGHVDSFNDFLDVGIPTLIRVTNATEPFQLELAGTGDQRRYVRIYIGTKDGSKLRYASPVEDDGTAIVPHACRLDNRTYA